MPFAIWLLLLSQSSAVRRARRSGERVHQLVTYGAARTSTAPLKNPATGDCFNGWRVINTNSLRVDGVPVALGGTFYHPNMETIKLGTENRYERWECGVSKLKLSLPSVDLHAVDKYVQRVRESDLPDDLKIVTDNGLAISYEKTPEAVQSKLQSGWEVVGSTDLDQDFSYLLKNEDDECILTFSGTNQAADWKSNLATVRVKFCGLTPRIHSGFRSELMRYVTAPKFVETIRPNLKKCARLTITGHSLGGAVASLFAACANNEAAAGDDENFTLLKWW